jgi:hypothetical protein
LVGWVVLFYFRWWVVLFYFRSAIMSHVRVVALNAFEKRVEFFLWNLS